MEPFAPFGLLVVFGFLWIPPVNAVFFDAIGSVMQVLDVGEPRHRLRLRLLPLLAGRARGGLHSAAVVLVTPVSALPASGLVSALLVSGLVLSALVSVAAAVRERRALRP